MVKFTSIVMSNLHNKDLISMPMMHIGVSSSEA